MKPIRFAMKIHRPMLIIREKREIVSIGKVCMLVTVTMIL